MDDVLKFIFVQESSIYADGVSTLEIKVWIPPEASDENNTITFRTSLGTFHGASISNPKEIGVKADSEGYALAILIAGTTVGTAFVSASVADFIVYQKIEFLRAHATEIVGETTSAVVSLDGSIKPQLTAHLTRDEGSVSLGTKVRFQAFQTDSNGVIREVGLFFPVIAMTNDTGVVTSSFAANTGDVIKDQHVTIVMATSSDEGGELTFQLNLLAK